MVMSSTYKYNLLARNKLRESEVMRMKKREYQNAFSEIVTLEHAAERTNLGISTVRKLANECGAALKIGRSYRINIQKLIDYLCTFENTEKR